MLTVASPPVDALEIRTARALGGAGRFDATRAPLPRQSNLPAVSIVYCFPLVALAGRRRRHHRRFPPHTPNTPASSTTRASSPAAASSASTAARATTMPRIAEFLAAIHRQPHSARRNRSRRLASRHHSRPRRNRRPPRLPSQAAKYSYAELDNFTDLIGRTLLGVPQASRVERKGVLPAGHLSELFAGAPGLLRHSGRRSAPKSSTRRTSRCPADPCRPAAAKFASIPPANSRTPPPSATSSSAPRPRRAGLPARPRPDQPRLPEPRNLSELLHLDRQAGAHASQPRHHPRRLHALRRADPEVRRRRSTRNSTSFAPLLPPDLIIARTSDQPLAGQGEHRPVHGSAVRSHRPGRADRADRLLGMALRAADGALHAHHAGHDVRHGAPVGIDLQQVSIATPDHRPRPSGRRSGGRQRRHQARTRRRVPRLSTPPGSAPPNWPAPSSTPPRPTSSPICRSSCSPAAPATSCTACRSS